MVKAKSKLTAAAGKLISAIQKEWIEELGEPQAEESERVMNRAHDILQASKNMAVTELLADQTVSEFLGVQWLNGHQSVRAAIAAVEAALELKST